eukprot:gene7995-9530_t
MVKQAHIAGKDVETDLTETQLNNSEIHSTLNEVEISEPTCVSVKDQFGLAGGSEDSEAEKVSQPDVPQLHIDQIGLQRNESHIQTNASDDERMNYSNKTRRVKHKVRKTRPSVPSNLPSRLRSLLNSISNLSQHNGTLCDSICNMTTYAEYVRPYLTYLHQLASDAYDAQSEKQNTVKVKVRKEPRIRKGVNWSIPKIVLRKSKLAADQSTGTTNAVEISSPQIRKEFEPKGTAQGNSKITDTSHHESMLEQNITILNNILVSKDAAVRELVQRLSILEQELSALRHAPLAAIVEAPTASTVEATVVEGEVSITSIGGGLTNQNPTETLEECNKDQSMAGDMTTTVSIAGTDGAAEADDVTIVIDSYELLQHVLNALYIVSASADGVDNHNVSESEIALQNDEEVTTVEPVQIDTAASEPVLPVTAIKAHTIHPSIVDIVISERRVQKQYLQRVYDAAAILAVALPYSVETATISIRDAPTDKEEDSTHNDVIVRDNEIISSTASTNDHPNPLLAVVETLENQVNALNDELTHISAQLCHYRGQHFDSDAMEEEQLTSENAKKFWFW